MLGPCAGHGMKTKPSIKADEAALVAHSQSHEIAVGDLPVAQQVLPVHWVDIQQAVVVGDKGVGWVCGSLRQAAGDCSQRQCTRIGGLGHDA